MREYIILIGLGLTLGLAANVQALDPDVKCAADKVKEAGKYGFCRIKAESKSIKKGEAPDFSKCDSKYSEKWQKAESKAEGACPTNADEATIQAQVVQFVDDLVATLNPGPCPAGGALAGGACWYLGGSGDGCDDTCTNVGLAYDAATDTYAGSSGTLLQCYAVLDALEETSPPNTDAGDTGFCAAAMGCALTIGVDRFRCVLPATTADAFLLGFARACACQ